MVIPAVTVVFLLSTFLAQAQGELQTYAKRTASWSASRKLYVDGDMQYSEGFPPSYTYATCARSYTPSRIHCLVVIGEIRWNSHYRHICQLNLQSSENSIEVISVHRSGPSHALVKSFEELSNGRRNMNVTVINVQSCKRIDKVFALERPFLGEIVPNNFGSFEVVVSSTAACLGMRVCRLRYNLNNPERVIGLLPFDRYLEDMDLRSIRNHVAVRGFDRSAKNYKLVQVSTEDDEINMAVISQPLQIVSSQRNGVYVVCYMGDTTRVTCLKYEEYGKLLMNVSTSFDRYTRLLKAYHLDENSILIASKIADCRGDECRRVTYTELFKNKAEVRHEEIYDCFENEFFGVSRTNTIVTVTHGCLRDHEKRLNHKYLEFKVISYQSSDDADEIEQLS